MCRLSADTSPGTTLKGHTAFKTGHKQCSIVQMEGQAQEGSFSALMSLNTWFSESELSPPPPWHSLPVPYRSSWPWSWRQSQPSSFPQMIEKWRGWWVRKKGEEKRMAECNRGRSGWTPQRGGDAGSPGDPDLRTRELGLTVSTTWEGSSQPQEHSRGLLSPTAGPHLLPPSVATHQAGCPWSHSCRARTFPHTQGPCPLWTQS
jgi:hypothetical protein